MFKYRNTPTKKRQSQRLHWLFWWKVEQTELELQVSQYKTLGWTKSVRKISTLCFCFSAVVTVLCIFFGVAERTAYLDAVMMVVLSIFIYFGSRIALIAAMILWTLEKLFSIIPTGDSANGGLAFSQLIWWCVYMHVFYFSFRVEQVRRRMPHSIEDSLPQ